MTIATITDFDKEDISPWSGSRLEVVSSTVAELIFDKLNLNK